ncbi:uncharacterized protein LOC131936801 [Physella acuta]|uniref:uncharacterized protein LOC131936801 n=1 Tax=Physella acuta TaxID=109671 RepID=UPI0027DC5917|nr:uncharacterized protein LOC131936801 [Physella acuta]
MPGDIPRDVLMNRFQYLADEDPNRDGYVFVSPTMKRIPLSRYNLWDLCGRYASRLRRYGIKTGDVVCSMIKTSRTKLISMFGAIAAGAVVVNGVTIQADGQDIFRVLNISKCKTIIASWENPEFVFLQKFLKIGEADLVVGAESIHPVQCDQAPWLKQLIVYELNSHEDHTAFLSRLADEEFYVAPVTADDEAYIFLTSGSTGYSKMVPRTNRECLAIADSFKQDIHIVLNNRIMEWMAGFPTLYLGSGATIIVQEYLDSSTTMDVAGIWNIACDEGADAALLLPVEIIAVKEAFDNGAVTRRIKRIITGGYPLKRCVYDLLNIICDEYHVSYGTTEIGYTIMGVVTGDMKDTVKDCYTGDRLVGSTQMKIVDEKTNMEITSRNCPGNLYFKGGTILRHFKDLDSNTCGAFKEDGWFDSSDVGYIE